MRVLITAGGTEEPIDGVRRLTNLSTGTTGAVIARHLAAQGADVLLLHAERARLDDVPVERETFVTFRDLEASLRVLLGERDWDAVVHLAAVSDYSVASVEVDGLAIVPGGGGKIATGSEVVLRLEANPKLIDSFREWSRNPLVRIVGFKLTDDDDPSIRDHRVRALLDRGVADFVVHNDLGEISADAHRATIWDRKGPIARSQTKRELAEALFDHVLSGVFA